LQSNKDVLVTAKIDIESCVDPSKCANLPRMLVIQKGVTAGSIFQYDDPSHGYCLTQASHSRLCASLLNESLRQPCIKRPMTSQQAWCETMAHSIYVARQ
jgi:hypothetical protein